jgi:hypothetical protein
VNVVPRREIETRQPFEIAEVLKKAFDAHCSRRRADDAA